MDEKSPLIKETKSRTVENGTAGKVEVVDQRGQWGKKADFLLSCIGNSVGLGNVWRFPYLCYQNGGASFLIPYLIMLAISGIPLFYLELAIGQYLSLGTVAAWTAVCPMARGIGFAMMVMSFLISIYYNVILAWCFLYLFESMTSEVPWKHCNNSWNTPLCSEDRFGTNETTLNCTALGFAAGCKYRGPSQEFFIEHILQMSSDITDMGSISWPITLCLVLAWIVIYFCLLKGIKSSGKVVYFTAIFPYVVLVILVIRGATLDGSLDGVVFFLKPDFSKLTNPKVWVTAASQVFFSLSVGFGPLITYASYNKFNHNCLKDAILVSVLDCITSIFAGFAIFSVLGFMAKSLKTTVDTVVDSGPGLVFVVYPEALSQMPVSTLWAILFFFMLLTLGVDSQWALVECVVTGLSDEYPKYLRKYKWLFLIVVCVILFLLGLPMCMQGGIYVITLFDSQSGGISLLFVTLCEALIIGWALGADQFCKMIESMTGKRPNIFFVICWKYLSPLVSFIIIIAQLVQWTGISFQKKPYPPWAEFLGWCLALASMMLIPIFAINKYVNASGTFAREKFSNGMKFNEAKFREIEEREDLVKGVSRVKVYKL